MSPVLKALEFNYIESKIHFMVDLMADPYSNIR